MHKSPLFMGELANKEFFCNNLYDVFVTLSVHFFFKSYTCISCFVCTTWMSKCKYWYLLHLNKADNNSAFFVRLISNVHTEKSSSLIVIFHVSLQWKTENRVNKLFAVGGHMTTDCTLNELAMIKWHPEMERAGWH